MRTTYVVTSYREPRQLERLVRLINVESPQAEVVVHRTRGTATLDGAQLGRCRVVITDEPVRWGDGSPLRALLTTLRGLRLAEGDWLCVVSEQCYPLRPLAEYEEHLSSSGADCFLEQSILTNPHRESLLRRARRRALRVPGSQRPDVRRVVDGVVRRSGLRVQTGRLGTPVFVEVPRLRTPFGDSLRPTMGSDWFVLRSSAVRALLDPANDALHRYYDKTFIPSEGYVHTVLLNRPDIVNRAQPQHYLRWAGKAHPEDLTVDDLDTAFASGAWWARKFTDLTVLDEVDRRRTAMGH